MSTRADKISEIGIAVITWLITGVLLYSGIDSGCNTPRVYNTDTTERTTHEEHGRDYSNAPREVIP